MVKMITRRFGSQYGNRNISRTFFILIEKVRHFPLYRLYISGDRMKKVILILLVLLTIGLNYNWQPIQMDDYAASQLMAEIKGAVVQPGSYEITEKTTISDLIELAGGPLEEADLSSLNLNKQVLHQSVIVIPVHKDDKISLNSASLEELMRLKGIGENKARLILEYREAHQGFNTIEEIMNVKGIGEKTFEKMKDQLAL